MDSLEITGKTNHRVVCNLLSQMVIRSGGGSVCGGDDDDDHDGNSVCIAVNVITSRHAACVLFYDDERERVSDE
jgi:hypothetical protein